MVERISPEKRIIVIDDLVFEYRTQDEIVEQEHSEEKVPGSGEFFAMSDMLPALDHVNLTIERGSFVAVIGRNGSGKSTLAKNINALLLPTDGHVIVNGLDTQDEESVWDIRRTVGMVFQNPDNQLVSAVVEDDVAFGPENLGVEPEEIRERIRMSLDAVDMYEHRKMAPHLLSGGQKQRVAIAGVVAMQPDIIVFDEPTAMLDPEGREEVMAIISKLHEEGHTILLITHFMGETVDADRVVIMDEGKIALDGRPADIFSHTDEIEALGLKLPFAVDMARKLREAGMDIPGDVLTPDALAGAVADLRRKAKQCLSQ